MTPLVVGVLVTACTFSGALFGLNIGRLLPEPHLTKETQEVVRLGTGMVSVLASLVLGLLIATAKTGSDSIDRALRTYATDLIVLKGTLRAYGSDTKDAQDLLKRS